jgi:hypothetical protein
MGMYEDSFYEVYNTIEQHGLRTEYEAQMEKMNTQAKWKHIEIKDKMQYACNKVVNIHKSKK